MLETAYICQEEEVFFLAKEIADHAAQLMVCFQSCFVLNMMVSIVIVYKGLAE